ncbi:MAG: GAF domain-containing sensor histidine kinase [Thermoleophilia bacterium]|nr:GAF domain-containing sensor histidine kinase [Thermoleophilia bacterium]
MLVRIAESGPPEIHTGTRRRPPEPTAAAVRALESVARGRRGLGVWRVGSARHEAVMGLWGAHRPAAHGTAFAARLTPASEPVTELLVGVHAAPDLPAETLAQRLSDLRARNTAPPPVVPPHADARTGELLETGIRLAAEPSLEEILKTLLESARRLLDSPYAALGVLDPSGTGIERFLTAGLDPSTARQVGEPPTGRGVLGVLLSDRHTLRLDRIAEDPRSCGFPPGHPVMTSFLGAPIIHRGRVFGNVYLADKASGPYTEEDERVLEILAAQAAAAISTARRLQEEHLRVVELEQLQGTVRELQDVLARGMSEERSLEELLPSVVGHALMVRGVEYACIAVAEDGELVVRVAEGPSRRALAVGDRTAEDLEVFAAALRRAARCPVEVVALRVAGELVGALGAAGEEVAEDGVRAMLSAVGNQLALAVANGRAIDAERERAHAAVALQLARANERATAEGFRRAIQAQEAERARIARELHDEAGQVLTAVSLHLRVLEDVDVDPAHRELLTDLRKEVVEAANHLHDLITDLRPAALREHGLASAIAQQAMRTSGGTGIHADVSVDALPDGLPEETEVAIFRVVQEALTNIARHSGAATFSVTAATEGDLLRVVIEDDGRGFDPEAVTSRHGLSGISERVSLLGGRLHVDSSPGRGAAVIVELDLSRL